MFTHTHTPSMVPSVHGIAASVAGVCSLAFWSHGMWIAGPLATHSLSLKSLTSSGPSFVTLKPEKNLMGAQPTLHAYPKTETEAADLGDHRLCVT